MPSGSETGISMSPYAVAAVSPKRRTGSCRYTWTGSTRPRSCMRSRLRKRDRSHSPSCSTTLDVASVSLSPAWSSSRAATLTASPKTSPPISTTSPCARPTWSLSGTGGRGGKVGAPPSYASSPPGSESLAGSTTSSAMPMRASESCMSSAALTPLFGRSNTAIRPSPSVLTTWPPWTVTMRARRATLRLTTAVASALPSVSYIAVLPRKSAKRTVRCRTWVMPKRGSWAFGREFIVPRMQKAVPASRPGPLGNPRSKRVEIRAQLVRAARMLELPDRLGLDLADPLAGDVELLADFLERVVGRHLDAEAHPKHLRLARRQRVEDVLDDVAQARLHRRLDRRRVVGVLDEVAEMRVVVVADRRLHRDRLLGDLHDLADLVLGDLHLLGERRRVGLEAELLQMLAREPVHLVDRLDHVDRDADRARLVGDRARDRLADPPRRVGRKLVAAAVFELVDRLHQADVAFLDQVEELEAPVGVLLGDRDHEAQVGLDHLLLGVARGPLALVHPLVDLLQVLERDDRARLLLGELFLQLLHRREITRQDLAVRPGGSDLLFRPLQVEDVRREALDEVVLRHAALVDQDLAQLALVAANVVDLRAQDPAQLFDRLHGEADRHQLGRDRLLRAVVGRRLVAVPLERLPHLLEVGAQRVELDERRRLQLLELLGQRLRAAVAVVVVLFVEEVDVLLGDVVVGFAFGDEAVDDLGDLHLARGDAIGVGHDLGDRRRRRADREHHRLQAALDPLGDLDLALAREQLDGAHLAHVHADRVGRAAEFGIDGGQGRLGGLLGLFLRGRRRAAAGDQQRRRVG